MPFACRKRLKSTPQPVLLGPDSTTAKVEDLSRYFREDVLREAEVQYAEG